MLEYQRQLYGKVVPYFHTYRYDSREWFRFNKYRKLLDIQKKKQYVCSKEKLNKINFKLLEDAFVFINEYNNQVLMSFHD